MPKRGNWGTWAVIEYPQKKSKCKQISCTLCTSYLAKEKRCSKVPNINPELEWKSCKLFYFKERFDTAKYWNLLERLRRLK